MDEPSAQTSSTKAAQADEGREARRRASRIKKIFGFTLKSPLGYNKQIKTARALIIQRFSTHKKRKEKNVLARRPSPVVWKSGRVPFCCSKSLMLKQLERGVHNFEIPFSRQWLIKTAASRERILFHSTRSKRGKIFSHHDSERD